MRRMQWHRAVFRLSCGPRLPYHTFWLRDVASVPPQDAGVHAQDCQAHPVHVSSRLPAKEVKKPGHTAQSLLCACARTCQGAAGIASSAGLQKLQGHPLPTTICAWLVIAPDLGSTTPLRLYHSLPLAGFSSNTVPCSRACLGCTRLARPNLPLSSVYDPASSLKHACSTRKESELPAFRACLRPLVSSRLQRLQQV